MAKITDRLTPTGIKSAKPKAKEYNLFDGDGLRLRINPNGSKQWIFNYYKPITGKRANLSLGRYPDLSLANACPHAKEPELTKTIERPPVTGTKAEP